MYLQRVFILNKQALKAEAAAPKRCSPPRGFPSQGMDPAFALRASSWCCAQSTAANPERGEVWAPILQFGAVWAGRAVLMAQDPCVYPASPNWCMSGRGTLPGAQRKGISGVAAPLGPFPGLWAHAPH